MEESALLPVERTKNFIKRFELDIESLKSCRSVVGSFCRVFYGGMTGCPLKLLIPNAMKAWYSDCLCPVWCNLRRSERSMSVNSVSQADALQQWQRLQQQRSERTSATANNSASNSNGTAVAVAFPSNIKDLLAKVIPGQLNAVGPVKSPQDGSLIGTAGGATSAAQLSPELKSLLLQLQSGPSGTGAGASGSASASASAVNENQQSTAGIYKHHRHVGSYAQNQQQAGAASTEDAAPGNSTSMTDSASGFAA